MSVLMLISRLHINAREILSKQREQIQILMLRMFFMHQTKRSEFSSEYPSFFLCLFGISRFETCGKLYQFSKGMLEGCMSDDLSTEWTPLVHRNENLSFHQSNHGMSGTHSSDKSHENQTHNGHG